MTLWLGSQAGEPIRQVGDYFVGKSKRQGPKQDLKDHEAIEQMKRGRHQLVASMIDAFVSNVYVA